MREWNKIRSVTNFNYPILRNPGRAWERVSFNMLLSEPQPTAYDLHFEVAGIRTRISPFFWLASLFLGWNLVMPLTNNPAANLNAGVGFVIWTIGVLLSILVHELGHALAFRYFGIDADIVLYHFGGLAIPRSSMAFGRQARLSPKQHIIVSFAGPAAQIGLAIVAIAIFRVGSYYVINPLPFFKLPFLEQGKGLGSVAWLILQYALIYASVWWALLNLLPVYPLDGGQIARDVFLLVDYRDGIRKSLILSIVAGAGIALWAFTSDQRFLGFMFGLLAYSSYQALQAYSGRGGFGGGW